MVAIYTKSKPFEFRIESFPVQRKDNRIIVSLLYFILNFPILWQRTRTKKGSKGIKNPPINRKIKLQYENV